MGRLQGQLDIPLNDTGRAQAAAAGEAIARRFVGVATVVSSDLSRALETAEASARASRLPAPSLDVRLRETHLGSWQGGTWADARPVDVAAWRGDPDVPAPGGGESSRQRFHRVCEAVCEVALQHVGSTAVLVAHGGVLDDIGRLARGTPWARGTGLRKPNCAIGVLEFSPAGGGGALAPAAARDAVARCDALRAATIDPAGAAAALGTWRIAEWGSVGHVAGSRLDPFADAAAWRDGAPGGDSGAPSGSTSLSEGGSEKRVAAGVS